MKYAKSGGILILMQTGTTSSSCVLLKNPLFLPLGPKWLGQAAAHSTGHFTGDYGTMTVVV